MKGKFLLSSIMLIILLTAAGTINAQTDSGTPPPVYGSGTLNYIPLFTGTSTIGNSVMYQGNSNIGIGTTSPISKLHINSGTQKMSFDKLDGTSLGYGRSYIGFNASRSSDESSVPWIVNGDGSNNGASVIWSNYIGNLYFAAIPTNNIIRGTSTTTTTTMNYSDDNILSYLKMIIQSSGNVGIGTISPSHRLQVDGGNILIRGTNNFQNNGDEAILNLGDNNNYIKSIYGNGLRIGSYCSGSSQDIINISSSGKVGIGTTNPISKLQVQGDLRISGDNDAIYMTINHDGGNFRINHYYEHGRVLYDYQNPGKFIGFCSDTTATSKYTYLATDGGTVGIGTTTPHAKFQVVGNSVFTGTTESITTAAYIRGLNTYSTATTPDYTWYGNDLTGIFHPAPNNIGFTINGTEKMRIAANGNVGIGTTTPGSKLEVSENKANAWAATIQNSDGTGNGLLVKAGYSTFGTIFELQNVEATSRFKVLSNGSVIVGNYVNPPISDYKLFVETGILSQKVKVLLQTEWPDYVLDNNYKLQSLNEVEDYISIHKHLPDIPSATEVKNNGIELGEMNTLLMKKVEELTLYLIQQQKEIDTLKKEISSFKK